MFNYDRTELLKFISDKLSNFSIQQIQDCKASNIIGQGISRTVFYYKEYPDIVFKIGIGSDGTQEEGAFDEEIYNYKEACNNGLEKYFLELELLGRVTIYSEEEYWSEEEEEIYKKESDEYDIYIQKKVDYTAEIFLGDYEVDLNEEMSYLYDNEITEVSSDELVSALFLKKSGVDEYRRLSDFVHKILCLDDLHEGNWGLCGEDMVIIDYAM